MWHYAVAVWHNLATRLRPSVKAGVERRQGMRYVSSARTAYSPVTDAEQERLPAAVRNVSFAGIGLLVGRSLLPGSLLHVELPSPRQERLLACVAHCTPDAESTWSVGCSFLRELSEPELRCLL
jgi:hypothetical protein